MADDTLDRIRFRSEPLADPAAVVAAGRARFTVLTSRLLRLEWSGERRFEDRASHAFPVRRGPAAEFTTAVDGDTTTVDTGDLLLRFTDDGRPFHAGNLSIELRADVATTWHPGDVDHANLGGARRTVDDCRGEAVLEPGLVSRSGWALHDDSALAVFDGSGWPVERATDVVDLYFFGYGHAYADAVRDYTRFGGAPAMIPRFVLGAWWSRYHAYDDAELRALVEGFAEHDLPLDVVVIDMDWHLADAWTGYTWNRELFPDPAGFLAWLHERGQKATFNLHPALGVQRFESAYPEFARRMGLDPASGEAVPFDITDREFVRNYLELLHHPLEDEGVDFWWMDWQQGRTTAVRGMDPLTWLNHLHFEDMHRRPGRRPVDFSRWGGLGSHRYPVGFSGDSFALWDALAFQPRYTAAGANVAYGWWSHDIGGHSGPDDPELYVRWVQFGAVSPVLRLHSNNQPESDRRPWAFGREHGAFGDDVLDLARDAFRLRYELLPYLYTAARTSVETGASVVRPTAWADPEHDGAYLARAQYLLGPDLVVAPVVRPVDPHTGLADVDVWLPEGDWIERTTGESFAGPRWVRLGVPLDRVPQFVAPGTVLPLAPVAATTRTPDHLTLEVFLGAGAHDGTARVYDDDGESTDDADGRWTEVTLSMPDASRAVLTVAPDIERSYTVRLPDVVEPADVMLDGGPVADWRWADTVLEVPVPRTATAFTVDVSSRSALSLTGADHDSQVRAAELAVITGSDGDPVAGVLGLGADSPARALGVARLGGPAVQVLEFTAPDEAVVVLGRVVVAAPEHGPVAEVSARWTLERDGEISTTDVDATDVTGTELVLDSPFAWDGTLHSARWTVDVTVRWGEFEVVRQHTSAVLTPALASWWVGVDSRGTTPEQWSAWALDPSDIDFGSLAQRVNLRFRVWDNDALDASTVGHAVTTVSLPEGREVAVSYIAGGEVAIGVDGEEVGEVDVTGHAPTKYFTLDPPARRTAAIRLAAGTHTLAFRCPAPANLADVDWYLSAWVTDPDGVPLLDVTADAGPAPA